MPISKTEEKYLALVRSYIPHSSKFTQTIFDETMDAFQRSDGIIRQPLRQARARACPVPLHHRRARSKVMEEKEGLKEFQSFLGKGLEVGGGGGCRSAQCSHDRLVLVEGREKTLSFFMLGEPRRKSLKNG